MDDSGDAPPNPQSPIPNPGTFVSEIGERALIERIRARVPAAPDWVAVGIGDDGAVVEPERNALEVITTDALVEGVHFDRAFVPFADVGRKALAVNLSDLAAMGASPRLALLSLALPASLPVRAFDELIDGFVESARASRVAVVGGNIARSTGPLVVDVTAIGSGRRRGVLTRGGARPGDELWVSGTIGAASAGLEILREAARTGSSAPSVAQGFSPAGPVAQGFSPAADPLADCAARYLRPEARVRLGVLAGRNRAASACVDLSDGLADAVRQIAAASGVGAHVDGDALPVHPGARQWFDRRGVDPVVAALEGGEDYELLLAVPPKLRGRFAGVRRQLATLPLTRIGVITSGAAVVLGREGRERELPAGYAHFR